MSNTSLIDTHTIPSPASPHLPFVNDIHRGEGPPVIMIHGLAASLHDWDFLLPQLASAGYSAYALDLLGHGESYKPHLLEEYTIERVFEHLETWLHTLDLPQAPVLIGHSLGGYLALLHALRFPGHTRALILVNPLYSLRQLSPVLQLIFRRQLVNTALIEHTPYWLFRALVDLSSLSMGIGRTHPHTLPESVRIQTARDYKRAAPGIFNIPRTLRDLTPDLGRVAAPTLVLWGRNDQTLAPRSFPRLLQALPNARGEAHPSCGHISHQCHPNWFNQRVLRFIASLNSKAGQTPPTSQALS